MDYTIRQGTRFPPNDGAVAWIDPRVYEDKSQFKPAFAALIVNEALAGCGLVTLQQDWLTAGMICMVRVENLAPLAAEIRWIRELGEGVVKIGVAFLE
ncbi:hypothetical protein [uncultured Thiodictyon sp.]|uniref:hypothetical protein n=1 Tax=uncultured Thiodictyon sp. TaxID=1846217 RepID=UPI0025FDB6B8|nr:hypothetical protein [uncultured Thiodictyon sp.]